MAGVCTAFCPGSPYHSPVVLWSDRSMEFDPRCDFDRYVALSISAMCHLDLSRHGGSPAGCVKTSVWHSRTTPRHMLPDTQLQRPGSPSFVVKQLTRWYIFLTSILKVDELAGSFPASHCTMRGGQRLLYFGLPTIAFGIKRSRVRPQMRDMTVCFLLRGQKKRGFGVGDRLEHWPEAVRPAHSLDATSCRTSKNPQ